MYAASYPLSAYAATIACIKSSFRKSEMCSNTSMNFVLSCPFAELHTIEIGKPFCSVAT